MEVYLNNTEPSTRGGGGTRWWLPFLPVLLTCVGAALAEAPRADSFSAPRKAPEAVIIAGGDAGVDIVTVTARAAPKWITLRRTESVTITPPPQTLVATVTSVVSVTVAAPVVSVTTTSTIGFLFWPILAGGGIAAVAAADIGGGGNAIGPQPSPTVTVVQPSPTVTVVQPSPTVTVVQPSPTVTITRPPPMPTITLPPVADMPRDCETLPAAAFSEDAEYRRSHVPDAINAGAAYSRNYYGNCINVGVLWAGDFDLTHPEVTVALLSSRGASNHNSDEGRQFGARLLAIIGARRDGVGFHGVAPGAGLLPIARNRYFTARAAPYTQTFDAIAGALDTVASVSIFVETRAPSALVYPSGANLRLAPADAFFAFRVPENRAPPRETLDAARRAMPKIVGEDALLIAPTGDQGWNSARNRVPVFQYNAGNRDYRDFNRYYAPSYLHSVPLSALARTGAGLREIYRSLDGRNDTNWLAKLPLRSGFSALNGHWIAVAALNRAANRIADYSNACGAAKNFCIAAPGSEIYATRLDGRYGTSENERGFSPPGAELLNARYNAPGAEEGSTAQAAAVVGGAVALLKQAFPQMTTPQIVSLILTTAVDLGAPGVDDVYGHGRLDLARAFAPVGTLTLAGARAANFAVDARLSPAFGDATYRDDAAFTARDAFNREYRMPFNKAGGAARRLPPAAAQNAMTLVGGDSAFFAAAGIAFQRRVCAGCDWRQSPLPAVFSRFAAFDAYELNDSAGFVRRMPLSARLTLNYIAEADIAARASRLAARLEYAAADWMRMDFEAGGIREFHRALGADFGGEGARTGYARFSFLASPAPRLDIYGEGSLGVAEIYDRKRKTHRAISALKSAGFMLAADVSPKGMRAWTARLRLSSPFSVRDGHVRFAGDERRISLAGARQINISAALSKSYGGSTLSFAVERFRRSPAFAYESGETRFSVGYTAKF